MYCVSPQWLGLLEMLHPEYEGSNNSIHHQYHWSRCLDHLFKKKEKEKKRKVTGKFMMQNFDLILKDVNTQELHHHLYEEDALVVPDDYPISC